MGGAHSEMDGGYSQDADTESNPLAPTPRRSTTPTSNHLKTQRYIEGGHPTSALQPAEGRAWMLWLAGSFVRRNMISEPRVWLTSSFAVCLCVVAIAVLYTAVGNVSMVFLKIVEDKLGECDLLMLPTVR